MTLRERIQKLCKVNGTSLNQVETELNFGKGYLSKLDNSTPNAKKMEKVADHFGVTVDFLMGKTDKIECKECGQTYNPFDEFDADIHKTYHQKILKARNACPFLMKYKEAIMAENDSISKINSPDIESDKILPIMNKYLIATFSLYVYKNYDQNETYSLDDFTKNKIIEMIKENLIPQKWVDYVLNLYCIDKDFLYGTDVLLARASKVDTLMRLLAYAEKLSPQMQKVLELQAKALSEQNPEE